MGTIKDALAPLCKTVSDGAAGGAGPCTSFLAEHPEILEIVREKDAQIVFGEEWHSDHSFQPLPASYSFLRATAQVTPYGTNNTEFAHCEAAWDAYSDTMKELLLPLDAYHSAGKAYGDGAKYGKTTPNSREAMLETGAAIVSAAATTTRSLVETILRAAALSGDPTLARDARGATAFASALLDAYCTLAVKVRWHADSGACDDDAVPDEFCGYADATTEALARLRAQRCTRLLPARDGMLSLVPPGHSAVAGWAPLTIWIPVFSAV